MTPSPQGEGKRIATDGGAVLAMKPLPPPSEASSPKGKALGAGTPSPAGEKKTGGSMTLPYG